MNLIVKNLHIDIDSKKLKALFSPFGTVLDAEVIYDKFNGYSRGFGYVKMKTMTDGFTAIQNLNGAEIMGQCLQVHEKLND